MNQIPSQHIEDSHKLVADGRIDLFALTPSVGTGTIYFKDGDDQTWRGTTYTGLPCLLSGEKKSDVGLSAPKLTIGQDNVDLSLFKPLVHDGYLDNAVVIRNVVLLDDLLNNRLIRQTFSYRVKRVEQYSRSQVVMQLATLSDSLGFSMPYRSYLPPAFPAVAM